MAHPLGVCQTPAVCSYRRCRGKIKSLYQNVVAALLKCQMMSTVSCGLFRCFPFQLAFGAAILNIKIPLMLGDLVNVVARYLREHTQNYVQEIRGPALKLLALYGLQVSTKINPLS